MPNDPKHKHTTKTEELNDLVHKSTTNHNSMLHQFPPLGDNDVTSMLQSALSENFDLSGGRWFASIRPDALKIKIDPTEGLKISGADKAISEQSLAMAIFLSMPHKKYIPNAIAYNSDDTVVIDDLFVPNHQKQAQALPISREVFGEYAAYLGIECMYPFLVDDTEDLKHMTDVIKCRPDKNKTAFIDLLENWGTEVERSISSSGHIKSHNELSNLSLEDLFNMLHTICGDLSTEGICDNLKENKCLNNPHVRKFLENMKKMVIATILEKFPSCNNNSYIDPKQETTLSTFKPLMSADGTLNMKEDQQKTCADLAGVAYDLERDARATRAEDITKILKLLQTLIKGCQFGAGSKSFADLSKEKQQYLKWLSIRLQKLVPSTFYEQVMGTVTNTTLNMTEKNNMLDQYKAKVKGYVSNSLPFFNNPNIYKENRYIFQGENHDGRKNQAGLLWHDNTENTLYITFRGSLSDPLIGMLEDEDWRADLNSVLVEDPVFGKVHAGFLKKFKSFEPDLRKQLDAFFKDHGGNPPSEETLEKLKNMKIIVTGHSLGAALAQLGSLWMTKVYLKEPDKEQYGFGPKYENKEENRLGSLALAAPRVISTAETKAMVEGHVGKQNMIRVNCNADLVPNGGMLPAMRDAILNFEIPGRIGIRVRDYPLLCDLISRITGFEDLGNLVQLPLSDVWKANVTGRIKRKFARFPNALDLINIAGLNPSDVWQSKAATLAQDLHDVCNKACGKVEALLDRKINLKDILEEIDRTIKESADLQAKYQKLIDEIEEETDNHEISEFKKIVVTTFENLEEEFHELQAIAKRELENKSALSDEISKKLEEGLAQILTPTKLANASGDPKDGLNILGEIKNLVTDLAAGTHNGVSVDAAGQPLRHYSPEAILPGNWQAYSEIGAQHMEKKHQEFVKSSFRSYSVDTLSTIIRSLAEDASTNSTMKKEDLELQIRIIQEIKLSLPSMDEDNEKKLGILIKEADNALALLHELSAQKSFTTITHTTTDEQQQEKPTYEHSYSVNPYAGSGHKVPGRVSLKFNAEQDNSPTYSTVYIFRKGSPQGPFYLGKAEDGSLELHKAATAVFSNTVGNVLPASYLQYDAEKPSSPNSLAFNTALNLLDLTNNVAVPIGSAHVDAIDGPQGTFMDTSKRVVGTGGASVVSKLMPDFAVKSPAGLRVNLDFYEETYVVLYETGKAPSGIASLKPHEVGIKKHKRQKPGTH